MERGTDPAAYTAGAIRAELARRNISRAKLAEKLGWKVSTTQRRLSGGKPFAAHELVAIADFLGVPLVDLLPGERVA